MFCDKCGAILADDDARFCSRCGRAIRVHSDKPPTYPKWVRIALLLALLVVAGVAASVLVSVFSDESPHPAIIIQGPNYNRVPKTRVEKYAERPVQPGAQAAAMMPADESRFISAVQEGQLAFRNAPNEMAQGGTRSERRVAICQALEQMSVAGWLGRIEKLSSNNDGKGVLQISLSDSVRVETWNNDLSDMFDHTLIDPSSSFFATLSQMSPGDRVVFSGTFIPSEVDCVKETSMTLDGSMTDPEFVFRFATVNKY